MSEFLELHFLQAAKYEAELRAVEDARYVAQHGDTQWKINDSTWTDYSAGVYFPGLRQTLDEVVVENSCESGAGIDIAGGSSGAAMLELLHRGILRKAAVTNYEDTRPEASRAEDHLDHIAGDLRSPVTWRKIIQWQQSTAPKGLKIAVHEPRDTLQWHSPEVYLGAAGTLLDRLAPAGLLVTQIPQSLGRKERKMICAQLEQRPDVAATFTSKRRGDYSQALVVKAS